MTEMRENQFVPDYVSLPGDTLRELIAERGMSQAELADRTGRSRKHLNEIIKGKQPITPEMALQLERALGVAASFWTNRQRDFDEARARIAETRKLLGYASWARRVPYRAMARLGWVRLHQGKADQVRELLDFFGVVAPARWEKLYASGVAFHKSAAFESDPGALAAWLRKGELVAGKHECSDFDPARLRAALPELRGLSRLPAREFTPRMHDVCARTGVAVALVPELPGARVCGAARWLSPRRALVQLSLRYKTDDHLWFAFFHELGHLLLHGKTPIYLDGDKAEGRLEDEAHRFAADTLLPSAEYRRFLAAGRYTEFSIRDLAGRLGIAPGIVLGRLQHDQRVPFSHLNHLKRRLQWAS